MTQSILLAYATNYGSTLEVAQAIAETLRGCGLEIDLQPAKQVKTLSGYSAVVLGAPLYMFRWHADAKKFLARHHVVLASIPVSIFALGPFHNKEDELTSARESLDKELANYAWLKPVSITVFPGKFDPAALRFPYNLLPALKNMPPSDERDWEAIRAWAIEIAGGLQKKEQ
jgi:menaquinone-dependent protoporphyrinogen oxidase